MKGYGLAPAAAQDLLEIAAYTIRTWGNEQSEHYEKALVDHFVALARGDVRTKAPLPGRPELIVSRCEHHYVFAVLLEGESLLILAVLHEKMDLMARLRKRLDSGETKH